MFVLKPFGAIERGFFRGNEQDRRQAVAGAPVESDVSFPQRQECELESSFTRRLLPGGRLQGLGYVCIRPSTQKDVAVVARGDADSSRRRRPRAIDATRIARGGPAPLDDRVEGGGRGTVPSWAHSVIFTNPS
jgi:hypothetical protein